MFHHFHELFRLDGLFVSLLHSICVLYLVVGYFLLSIKAPTDAIYRPYRRSKRILAFAYIVASANLLLWSVFYTGDWRRPVVLCNDLVMYYLLYILFGYAFCNLLNHHYITRRRILTDMLTWGLCILVVAASRLDSLSAYSKWIMDFGVVLLFEYIVRFLYHFRKLYLHNNEVLDSYYADDMRRFVGWLNKSIVLMLVYAFLAIVALHKGILFNFVFQAYAVCLNLYVVTTFMNYASRYGDIERAYIEWEEQRKPSAVALQTMAENAKGRLESKLKVWLAGRHYLSAQFTIESLAAELGTNRSYLSRFINETYHMSFSEWLSGYKIAEAKALMVSEPATKLEDIAYRAGFSSSSYFSKVFSRMVGKSPLRWREEELLHSDGV